MFTALPNAQDERGGVEGFIQSVCQYQLNSQELQHLQYLPMRHAEHQAEYVAGAVLPDH